MIISILKYIAALVLILLVNSVDAQESKSRGSTHPGQSANLAGPHSLHVELAGRTFLFGSVNYEYAVNQKFSIGSGLGIINIQAGEITRDLNGSPETGTYLDMATSQMIYGNYFIGKKRNQLVLTAGVSNFLVTYRNRYPSETIRSAEAQLAWNAGIGYQHSANRYFFRFTAYLLSLPEPSGWFPEYMPWAGISTGFKLK